MEKEQVRAGLEGVVVAETEMSRVDGQRGELIVGGYDIHDLAGERGFEDICHLLWRGRLPGDQEERATIARAMARGRERGFASLSHIGEALSGADAMDALRGAMAQWRSRDGGSGDDFVIEAAEITGAMAVFTAAWWRRICGEAAIAPDRSLRQAADYLRMLGVRSSHESGHESGAEARALDTYWATVADHGMNASTFAARVVTSTGSDTVSAVVAALGALKGPLHGGAPGPVLDMLDAIVTPDRAAAWIDQEIGAGRRIMGMGHRVYRVRDPRAAVLERAAEILCRASGAAETSGASARTQRLILARAVEDVARERLEIRHPGRALRANVEFYTAILLDALGIDRRLFSATFAIARSAGWCGHIAEQRRTGRLIRPTSRYVGELRGGRGANAALPASR